MDGRPVPLLDKAPVKAFLARAAQGPDPRLAEVMGAVVAQLADLVERLNPTRAEMRALIAFLTEVGEATSARRQEWVLLADALGLTSAVENRIARRPDGATPNTLAGPFYRPGAPARKDGETISLDGAGEELVFAVEVADLDGAPVAGATVEVWQANGAGLYENQEPDTQPEHNLRGTFRTGRDGRVTFRSVRPSGYPIPADGPVGRLLSRLGLPVIRPAHLHFRISAPGFQRLTTHVFDRADPAIDRDPLFAVHPELLADFARDEAGAWRSGFRFVLARARPGREGD